MIDLCLFWIFGFKCVDRIAPPPEPPVIVRPRERDVPVRRRR